MKKENCFSLLPSFSSSRWWESDASCLLCENLLLFTLSIHLFSLNVCICSRWWKAAVKRYEMMNTRKICKMQTSSRTKGTFCRPGTEEFQITNVIRITSCSVSCLCLWSCNHLMEKHRIPPRSMIKHCRVPMRMANFSLKSNKSDAEVSTWTTNDEWFAGKKGNVLTEPTRNWTGNLK